MGFPDQNLSVACLLCRRQLFTFLSLLFKGDMTKEEWKRGGSYKIFWWNIMLKSNKLCARILGGRAFKFVQMKNHLIFKGKIHVLNWLFEKPFFQNQKTCIVLTLVLLIYCRLKLNNDPVGQEGTLKGSKFIEEISRKQEWNNSSEELKVFVKID